MPRWAFNVKITFAQKFGDDLFDVFTDITGFGQSCGICHNKGTSSLRAKDCANRVFTWPVGPISRIWLDNSNFCRPLLWMAGVCVVVNRYRQRFFAFPADNVVVEVGKRFSAGRQFFFLGGFFFTLANPVFNLAGSLSCSIRPQVSHAFVADEGVFTFNQILTSFSDSSAE